MIKNSVFFLFIIFSFYSCSIKNEKNGDVFINTSIDNNFTLKLVDTVVITLDKKTSYNGAFKLESINDIEYLGILKKESNIYSYYNIADGILDKSINFDRVGPNGVGQVRYVSTHNWDSIFLIQYHTNKLFLLNSNSDIINKWVVDNTVTGEIIYNISANFAFNLHYMDNVLSFWNISNSKAFTKSFWDTYNGISINIETNTIQNRTGKYPSIYKNGVCYGNFNINPYRIVTRNNQQVFGFSLDNRLFIYNDTSLIKISSVISPHIKVDAPKPQKKLTGYNNNEDWMYEIQRGSYRWMVYDKYDNIIYRVVMHTMNPYDVDGNRNNVQDKPFSIQIIDSTFSLVGEVEFPAKRFEPGNMFATKNGLLISLCHNDNPILEEDKLKLALFKLVKINE